MTDETNEMYRRILEKIVKENRAEHFFDKILDGYSVTIDAKSGELVYARFQDAGYDHASAFALSLFQWKDINSADDLPEVEGGYLGLLKNGEYLVFHSDPKMNDHWHFGSITAYIPVAIPEYGKEER
jgi:hypothetical protein